MACQHRTLHARKDKATLRIELARLEGQGYPTQCVNNLGVKAPAGVCLGGVERTIVCPDGVVTPALNEQERERVCVRERARENARVCVRERERVCVSVCVRER